MTERTPGRWPQISLVTVPSILILGDVIGYLSQSGFKNPWFAGLIKPFFMPPGWAFAVAWSLLYILMGIALAMVLAEPPSSRRKFSLVLFFVQLALNYAWSPIFFVGHDIALAKVVIFVMAAIAAAAAGQFMRIRKAAGLMLIPYLAWLIFAATLNSTIDTLNPGVGKSLLG
jgi:tryptophan-rich sensory protein